MIMKYIYLALWAERLYIKLKYEKTTTTYQQPEHNTLHI